MEFYCKRDKQMYQLFGFAFMDNELSAMYLNGAFMWKIYWSPVQGLNLRWLKECRGPGHLKCSCIYMSGFPRGIHAREFCVFTAKQEVEWVWYIMFSWWRWHRMHESGELKLGLSKTHCWFTSYTVTVEGYLGLLVDRNKGLLYIFNKFVVL